MARRKDSLPRGTLLKDKFTHSPLSTFHLFPSPLRHPSAPRMTHPSRLPVLPAGTVSLGRESWQSMPTTPTHTHTHKHTACYISNLGVDTGPQTGLDPMNHLWKYSKEITSLHGVPARIPSPVDLIKGVLACSTYVQVLRFPSAPCEYSLSSTLPV